MTELQKLREVLTGFDNVAGLVIHSNARSLTISTPRSTVLQCGLDSDSGTLIIERHRTKRLTEQFKGKIIDAQWVQQFLISLCKKSDSYKQHWQAPEQKQGGNRLKGRFHPPAPEQETFVWTFASGAKRKLNTSQFAVIGGRLRAIDKNGQPKTFNGKYN